MSEQLKAAFDQHVNNPSVVPELLRSLIVQSY
jgi:hypothetical protein